MKKIIAFLFVAVLAVGLFFLLPEKADAATSGNYTYTISNGQATITKCSTSASGAITIPSKLGGYPVTSIGDSAFSNCTGLTSIKIGNGVTSIGYCAFSGCTGLKSITIPDSVTSIGNGAFQVCMGLKGVYITNLAAWCRISFSGSSSSSSNPLSLAHNLYLNGTLITDLVIPDSVTSIGDSAFYNCTSLTSITIPNSVTSIGWNAFYGCTGLASITIPDSVTSIGNSAFEGCMGLTSITIPDGVSSIGSSVFSGCKSLENLTIPFVGESIKTASDTWQEPFGNIFGTTSYTGGVATEQRYYGSSTSSTTSSTYYIPSTLKSVTVTGGNILYGAFYNCTGLTSITIGDSVTSIGDYAFFGCTGLTSITVPDSVTSIGNSAFSGCKGLTSITIGSGVTSIRNFVFEYCSSLTSIKASSRNISYHTAGNCLIETASKTLILGCKTSVIPTDGSVTSIGYNAFKGCTGLTTITIPDSVTSIGEWAFSGCSNLQYNVYDQANYLGNSENPYVALIKANSTSITACTIHPNTKVIYGYAFSGCTDLTSITIPDSVTSIEHGAFSGCTGLTSITIPDSVTKIDVNAFNGCTIQELIVASGSKTVSSTLRICKDTLKKVVISDGVTSIGKSAFSGCTGLTSITIPDSVTDIEEYAFSGCTRLKYNVYDQANYLGNSENPYVALINANSTSITSCAIHPNTKVIYRSAFANCTNLTTITIPDSVSSIGYAVFSGCKGLTSVTIPDSVTSIGNDAFSGCTGLKTVYYRGTEQQKVAISIGSSNTPLINANWVYPAAEIQIVSNPIKTEYFVNDVFVPDGLIIKVFYTNSTSAILSDGFAVSSPDMTTVGTKTVTVTYNDFGTVFTTTFEIQVYKRVSSAALHQPTKKQYEVGEALDLEGLYLYLVYDDGTSETVNEGFTVSGFDSALAGEKKINLSYHLYEASFPVTVVKRAASLAVKTLPKTQYEVGEELNTSGLVLTLTYNDGTTEEIAEGFTTAGFSSALGGEKTVTVTYQGVSATFTVQVVKRISSSDFQNPTKSEYEVGDEFDPAGIALTLHYNDGTTETADPAKLELSGFSSEKGGSKTVTVTYKDYSTTFKVSVVKRPASLAVKTKPKTQYEVGEELNTSGLVLTLTYNDGTTEEITSGFETLGFDSSKGAVKTLTFSYSGVAVTLDVTVVKRPQTLSISTPAAKTQYEVNETLDLAGLSLILTYNDGTTEDAADFTHSGFSSAKGGVKTVTLTYKGVSTSFTVEVIKRITSSQIHSMPVKTVYAKGEAADFSGMSVTLSYNDGTSETVISGFVSPDFDTSTVGGKTVMIQYGSFMTFFDLTVKEATGMTLKTAPTKNQYEVGEALDTTGLVLTLTYSDNSTEDVTTGFTVSGFDSAKAGTKTVTVAISGFTASFDVTVVKRLSGVEVKTAPTKNQYEVGEALDTAGLVLTLTYNDGTTEDVATGFTVSGYDSESAGVKDLTVTYEGKTAQFTVQVLDPSIPGDADGDEVVTDADAIYVLMHTFFPDLYPIEDESAFDFDGDGVVTDADAIYLLMYTFFPEMYPIALPPKQFGV